MIRKILTIFSLLALLSSMWLAWESQHGAVGYVNASGNTLYALNDSIRLGRITWEKVPASETGIYYRRSWATTDNIQVTMSVPMAFFAICFLYFSLSLFPNRRRTRKKLGLCVQCGYDLRGSKGRCPECGTDFESSGVEGLGSSMGDADG